MSVQSPRRTDTEITVEYDGLAVANGLMDVADLAPSILALARLCAEVNTTLNGSRALLTVQVKAQPRRGSFGLDLHLVQTALSTATAIVDIPQVKGLAHVLEVIGIFGGAALTVKKSAKFVATSVFSLIRYLRGRSVAKTTPIESDSVEFQLSDGIMFIVPVDVYQAWAQRGVRDDARRFTEPLRHPGYDEIRFKRDQEVTETISSADAEYYETLDADVLSDDVSTRFWEVRSITLDPTLQWKFFEGRQTRINAHMEDSVFLGRLANREISLVPGDYLKLRVRTVTSASTSGKLLVEHFITEVLEIRVRRQALPFSDDAPDTEPGDGD